MNFSSPHFNKMPPFSPVEKEVKTPKDTLSLAKREDYNPFIISIGRHPKKEEIKRGLEEGTLQIFFLNKESGDQKVLLFNENNRELSFINIFEREEENYRGLEYTMFENTNKQIQSILNNKDKVFNILNMLVKEGFIVRILNKTICEKETAVTKDIFFFAFDTQKNKFVPLTFDIKEKGSANRPVKAIRLSNFNFNNSLEGLILKPEIKERHYFEARVDDTWTEEQVINACQSNIPGLRIELTSCPQAIKDKIKVIKSSLYDRNKDPSSTYSSLKEVRGDVYLSYVISAKQIPVLESVGGSLVVLNLQDPTGLRTRIEKDLYITGAFDLNKAKGISFKDVVAHDMNNQRFKSFVDLIKARIGFKAIPMQQIVNE